MIKKKTKKETEQLNKRQLEEAVHCIEEFMDTGRKSMYMYDAWFKIKDALGVE